MSIRRVLPIAIAAMLAAGCATHPTHAPPIDQQDATPRPVQVLTESGQRVLFESPMTEQERGAWVRQNMVPQTYAPPVRQVEVVRVVEQPVYVERPYRYVPPVHLNLGYSWRGHHRGHGGWHTGLGWSVPLW